MFFSDIKVGELTLKDVINRAERGEYFENGNRLNGCYFWKERRSCWNSMSNIEWLGRKLFYFIPGIYSVRDISILRTFQNINGLYDKTLSTPYRALRHAVHVGNETELEILRSISEVRDLIETSFSFSKLEKLPSALLAKIASFLPEKDYSPCPLKKVSKILHSNKELELSEASRLAALSKEKLDQRFNTLLMYYTFSISSNEGTGMRGQYYIDENWKKLQSFIEKYPVFAARMPKEKHIVSDNPAAGLCIGLSGLSTYCFR